MIFDSERTPPTRVTLPASPSATPVAPKSHLGFVIALFVLGMLVFIGTMMGLGYWLRESSDLLSEGSGATFALPSDAPGALTTSAGGTLGSRDATHRNEFRVFFTADGTKLDPQVRRPEGKQKSADLQSFQRLHFVLRELLMGPPGETLRSPLPPNVSLRGAYILQDTAVVDLSPEILKQPQGGPMAELLCVYAIVNTVIENVEGIAKVRILVDGKSEPVLWDQVDLTGALAEDASLIR
jgi:hypothetical protein